MTQNCASAPFFPFPCFPFFYFFCGVGIAWPFAFALPAASVAFAAAVGLSAACPPVRLLLDLIPLLSTDTFAISWCCHWHKTTKRDLSPSHYLIGLCCVQ
ncbi:hypothetical protein F5H01DRAFT_379999 [Linnemannia elongata]|nr:hypothetical protein F5H01DRAFT_379999 [Linnemannia elongata]